MREEKLEEIRNQIKKLKNSRKKYIGRKKRMEKLSSDPKVQEYIRLQQAQQNTDKFVKSLDSNIKDITAQKEIRKHVFQQAIDKMPAEETNDIYVYQGKRKMDSRLFVKYHNLEKQRSIFIPEEKSDRFESEHTVILPPAFNVPIEEEEKIFNELQNEFFEIALESQEKAKHYMLTKYTAI